MPNVAEIVRHPLVGENAPDTTVNRALDRADFALSQLWQDGPAVLVFLRHLGCTFCREHTAQLRRDLDTFRQHGAQIGFLTVGKPEDTTAYCAERGLVAPFVCLSDPDKRAYSAYGLSRGSAGELFSPHVVARGFQATLHGHIVGLPKGDPYQMPGVFIVDRTGVVRYAHRSRDAADNPPNADLFAVLAAL